MRHIEAIHHVVAATLAFCDMAATDRVFASYLSFDLESCIQCWVLRVSQVFCLAEEDLLHRFVFLRLRQVLQSVNLSGLLFGGLRLEVRRMRLTSKLRLQRGASARIERT